MMSVSPSLHSLLKGSLLDSPNLPSRTILFDHYGSEGLWLIYYFASLYCGQGPQHHVFYLGSPTSSQSLTTNMLKKWHPQAALQQPSRSFHYIQASDTDDMAPIEPAPLLAKINAYWDAAMAALSVSMDARALNWIFVIEDLTTWHLLLGSDTAKTISFLRLLLGWIQKRNGAFLTRFYCFESERSETDTSVQLFSWLSNMAHSLVSLRPLASGFAAHVDGQMNIIAAPLQSIDFAETDVPRALSVDLLYKVSESSVHVWIKGS